MIKSSEESKIRPAKNIAYAKITETALEIQHYLTPEKERRDKPNAVFFGETDARPDYYKSISIETFEQNTRQYHKKVRAIIDLTGFLLEPDVQTHINALERNLEKSISLFDRYKSLDELSAANPLLPAVSYVEVTDSADKLVSLMLKKSTSTIPFDFDLEKA